jgi:hypothetical protein
VCLSHWVAEGAGWLPAATVITLVTAADLRPVLSVTTSVTVKLPTLENRTDPGFCDEELLGLPPEKVHR